MARVILVMNAVKTIAIVIPGIGRLIVDAISRRDYPVIQGAMLVVSVVQIGVNLMVDVSYSFFDPRIKY